MKSGNVADKTNRFYVKGTISRISLLILTAALLSCIVLGTDAEIIDEPLDSVLERFGAHELAQKLRKADTESKGQSLNIVGELAEKLTKNEIYRIEIYIFDRSIEEWGRVGVASEKNLFEDYGALITLRKSKIYNSKTVRKLITELERFRLYEVSPRDINHHLGYVFYSDDQETFRIIFGGEPLVKINGKFYLSSTLLLTPLIELLPTEDGNRVYESFLARWDEPYRKALLKKLDDPKEGGFKEGADH